MPSMCGIGPAPEMKGPRGVLMRKLLVVGDGACGKTSLLHVYIKGVFPRDYEPTVFENYVHVLSLPEENATVELSLWDTAGQEDFDRLRGLCYADTNVVLVCFSADNPVSLENVESKWIPEVNEYCPGIKICLVALKCDTREDQVSAQKLATQGSKATTYEEGILVARRIKAARYLECSAMFNRGVSDVFLEAARLSIASSSGHGGNSKCVIL